MKVYGVTGGVGMGKSVSYRLLGDQGETVVDTDLIARELVEPGQLALSEVVAAFGDGVLSPEGRLRRDELARRVFSDSDQRLKLESILHPRIQQRWLAQMDSWRGQGRSRCFVVIPLLFEKAYQSHFDVVVSVACSTATQHLRLAARGWDADQIEQRLAAQWPVEKKLNLSQRVVWTEGDLAVHAAQWAEILD